MTKDCMNCKESVNKPADFLCHQYKEISGIQVCWVPK